MTPNTTTESLPAQDAAPRTEAEPFTPLGFLRFALSLTIFWALACWVLLGLLPP
ncbi:hypothetical protein [Variovorax sp. HJSM1_2]|uniref:hypothetical protein n=1 Tax=Variovorax sp. HJSM1_2 TaxID=3366263 RepID=UPI003BC3EDF6